jgi:thiamine-phosphate pyrophosphorylase
VKPLVDCRLYTFVDTAYLHGRDPVEITRQLCDGGSDLVQLRAKGSTVDEVRRLADVMLPVTESAGVGLVINDHPGVARAVGAPLVHLGQEDFFGAGHTRVSEFSTGAAVIGVGLSTHAPDQALRAMAAGADYLAIGPVYPTPTKPGRPPVTLDYVRWAAAHVPIPWFAIGGITLQNVNGVLAAGARGICVVSAVLNEPDIVRACREFRRRVDVAPRLDRAGVPPALNAGVND